MSIVLGFLPPIGSPINEADTVKFPVHADQGADTINFAKVARVQRWDRIVSALVAVLVRVSLSRCVLAVRAAAIVTWGWRPMITTARRSHQALCEASTDGALSMARYMKDRTATSAELARANLRGRDDMIALLRHALDGSGTAVVVQFIRGWDTSDGAK